MTKEEALVRIRSARNDDWKTCLTLNAGYETDTAWQMEELHGDGEWGMHFREVRLPRRQQIKPLLTPEEHLRAWQRCDGFWVATERSKILGYLTLVLEVAHRQARISDLVVAPAHRRKGVAGRLLQHATAWALRQDVEQLILECPLKAKPAIAFARKHHFVVCGFQDVYWPGRETGLFFRKRIR